MNVAIEKTIRKFALDNARKYNGSPNVGAVIAKVIGEHPEVKSQLKELSGMMKAICEEVSKLSVDEQVRELQLLAPELLEKKVVEGKKLKPLVDAQKGKVVLRLAPSPSGPMHIGHAVVFSLSHLYCKEYDGKLILRFEDTDPGTVYAPAYKMLEDDMRWLMESGIHDVVVQSDRLDLYYDYGEQLIAKGKAYVCTCNPDVWRALSAKKKGCPCRELSIQEQHARWDKMFVEYEPGEAVVRIKTNIEDPNPAMRDWPAFRINHNVHPRVKDKYKVWPLMNFAVAIDDHEMGVTHTVRGKDHVDNAKRQQHLYDFFGWKAPIHAYTGKMKLQGLEVSKRKMRAAIERGVFDDWDDIRLPTVVAFRRRGFQPGAFHAFAHDVGLGLNDKVVPAEEFFKSLEAHNRSIIDPLANRYFFVHDPVKVTIKNAPILDVKVALHPEDAFRGVRRFKTNHAFVLSQDDVRRLREGKLYRLKDCLNFRKVGNEFVFDSVEYSKAREENGETLHWLPSDSGIFCKVVMQDKSSRSGLVEGGAGNLKVGDIVQFERFGFCRLDKRAENSLVFWFTHK